MHGLVTAPRIVERRCFSCALQPGKAVKCIVECGDGDKIGMQFNKYVAADSQAVHCQKSASHNLWIADHLHKEVDRVSASLVRMA